MYKGKRILATISARGGSKGVPGKNIRDLGGRPLIAWTIGEGRRSEFIDRLIVSSDDERVLAAARASGAETPFVRPAELCRDDTPGVDPVLHAVSAVRPETYDYVALLQPTSPLRTVEDIDGCIRLCLDNAWPCCVTVCEAGQSPYYMFRLDAENRMAPVIPQRKFYTCRQALPKVFLPNGAVYVADCAWLARTRSYLTPETRGYVMPQERSWDVNDLFDFAVCEMLLKKAGRIA